MRRRHFVAAIGGSAIAWPLRVSAQQVRRVGVLMNVGATSAVGQSYVKAFTQKLGELGWIEGRNIRIDTRWNATDAGLAQTYAAQLIGLQPDAILSASTSNLMILRQATNTIPIVFVQVSDPVAQGFISNLTHPGGNVTGFSAFEFSIGGKWVDLLKQAVPQLTRVAVCFTPNNSPQTPYFLRAIQGAAQTLGVQVIATPVRDFNEFEAAAKSFAQEPNGGLIFPTGGLVTNYQSQIIATTIRHRLPAIAANNADFVENGGLFYYGYSGETADQYRYAASYVDRILNGAKPGDLPVQRATKYVLIINLKTAKALGITVPLSLLGLADKVIE